MTIVPVRYVFVRSTYCNCQISFSVFGLSQKLVWSFCFSFVGSDSEYFFWSSWYFLYLNVHLTIPLNYSNMLRYHQKEQRAPIFQQQQINLELILLQVFEEWEMKKFALKCDYLPCAMLLYIFVTQCIYMYNQLAII